MSRLFEGEAYGKHESYVYIYIYIRGPHNRRRDYTVSITLIFMSVLQMISWH